MTTTPTTATIAFVSTEDEGFGWLTFLADSEHDCTDFYDAVPGMLTPAQHKLGEAPAALDGFGPWQLGSDGWYAARD